jgi:hypothetical protein
MCRYQIKTQVRKLSLPASPYSRRLSSIKRDAHLSFHFFKGTENFRSCLLATDILALADGSGPSLRGIHAVMLAGLLPQPGPAVLLPRPPA